MRQSQQVLEWQEQARQEGLMEGQVIGQQAALVHVLEKRFQTVLPADLADAISRMTDLEQMLAWLDAAVAADSLDTFRAAIQH